MKKYTIKSGLWGIISTGNLQLLFSPDTISLDFNEKEITIINSQFYKFGMDKIIRVGLNHHKYCIDMIIETRTEDIIIKCLNNSKAYKIKDILDSYIWNRDVTSKTNKLSNQYESIT